ncbi:MAG TPA: TraR/DksA family transcriptional regulator [bacterium]|nr:TraR/DksA family transcriptional regulator [bacterium]
MEKKDLEFFKKLILEKRAEILRELGVIRESSKHTDKESSGDDSTYSIHMADHGTDEEQKEKVYYHATRENRYLLHLEEALNRIEAGNYGICMGCGNYIPKERLEAVPHTKLCVPCKLKEKNRA